MNELTLLLNIAEALMIAFIGGVIARRNGLPTMVGYLLAGIVIGPFTPGFVGDTQTIQQLAELGVIYLMFGVGLRFSFQDLWKVGAIVIPGALLQTSLATLPIELEPGDPSMVACQVRPLVAWVTPRWLDAHALRSGGRASHDRRKRIPNNMLTTAKAG